MKILNLVQIKGIINDNIKKPSKPWISNFLENIFRIYPGTKSKSIPVVGSKLSEIFLGFKHDLKTFANNLPYNETPNPYETYSVHSVKGKWINYPKVYLYDINLRKNDKYESYPFLISYNFSEDIQEVYISLRMNWNYADLVLSDTKGEYTEEMWNDYFKSEISKARAKLMNNGKISKDSNWGIPKDANNRTIFFKYYQKGNLPKEKVLQNDLIEILDLYQDLIQSEPEGIGFPIIKKLFKDLRVNF